MNNLETSRRGFLKMMTAAGGGLIVGVPLAGCANTIKPQIISESGAYKADAFIQISPSNNIHFYLPRSEMGQGVYHGLTTLIAEELFTDPDLIQVHHGHVDEAFINDEYGVQGTGGSNSIKVHYLPLRQAAANTRDALLIAASSKLGVAVSTLELRNSHIIHNGTEHPFADFIDVASQNEMPTVAALKDPKNFLFIGKDRNRIDAAAKTDGTAQFGIDVDFPGLQRAVLTRCPVRGGTVKSYSDDAAKLMPGVTAIVVIDNGVAVVAESYWQARQASNVLEIEWDLPELAQFNSSNFKQVMQAAMDEDDGNEAHKEGAGAKALVAGKTFSAEYWAPYLAHATMEPMNCTVKIEHGRCEVWLGCQAPDIAQGLVAIYAGVDRDNVTINSTFLGGGFGRRAYADYAVEATQIAKASGLPVQLIWSREDDTQNDYYRPASLVRFNASVTESGLIDTLVAKRAGPDLMPYQIDSALPAIVPSFVPLGLTEWLAERSRFVFEKLIVDEASVEGLVEDYDVPNKELRHVTVDPGLPCGAWRSVGHSSAGFFKESFIDELAFESKQDPVNFRLNNSKKDQRFHEVLRLVAEKANWSKPKYAGASQGIAAHSSFNSRAAQVAEVSVINGQITVHRIVCAIDCGLVVNPDVVKTQMEGCINFALTAALYGNIDVVEGVVKQSNFHDYPILRMDAAPEIEVYIVPSQDAPTGVGEPGVPPLAAAVANAIFVATGQRLRSLPLTLG